MFATLPGVISPIPHGTHLSYIFIIQDAARQQQMQKPCSPTATALAFRYISII